MANNMWNNWFYQQYVYEEVILQTRFSDTGAAQFKFDMLRGLFPIFGEFTQKPENFFKL